MLPLFVGAYLFQQCDAAYVLHTISCRNFVEALLYFCCEPKNVFLSVCRMLVYVCLQTVTIMYLQNNEQDTLKMKKKTNNNVIINKYKIYNTNV